MATIEYARVVDGGKGWTRVQLSDGRTVTVKGDRATRNNNPGNIQYGDFARRMGAIGTDGRFAVFPSRDIGVQAQAGLLFGSKYGNLTLSQAINKYAPEFENNTSAYKSSVSKRSGIPLATKMADIPAEARDAVLSAMHEVEGNTGATITDDATGEPLDLQTYSPPQNTSNPFEAQPGVGIAGHAYEGLLGSASPGDGLLGTQSAPQLAGGTAQDTLSRWAAGQDFGAKQQAAQRDYEAKRQMSANSAPVAQNEADVQRMEREQGMYQPQGLNPSRFGGLLDAPGISPERYGTTTQDMALAHLMSDQPSFEPGPNQQFASAGATQGAFQSPSSTINKMVDGMMNTPSAVAQQPADTAPDPAAVAALQGNTAPPSQTANIAPGLIDTPQLGFAPTGAGFMPGMESPRSFTPWGAALDAPMSAAAQQTVPDPSATQDQTISYPEQPEQPSQLDAAMASPAMKKVKDVLGLLNPMAQARGLLGDPIGKLAGLLGGPAGVSPANIDAGSGMRAMEQGMYGERGTFGRSLSNPGAFSVSRGPNQGYDLHNAQGVVTPYDSSGHIMANRDTMRAWGGLLDHLFGGGLLDRPDKDKDKSRGGPVGGYSGNGLY